MLAGLIALVQTDIKRVIAYSTMSQIGYMFLGAGLGAYANGMFHLVTHAFFKALLFLAAGLVIHHLAGEQDIRRMGGLRRFMPQTWLMFLVGSLALVGVPPFAGFWSKDAILASALARDGAYGWILLVAGLFGALLTGIYTFRLFFLVFYGEPSELVLEHVRGPRRSRTRARGADRATTSTRHGEGPLSMVLPVAILTVLSADRRPARDRGRLAPVRSLGRPGRAAARRADDRAGLGHERDHRRARAGRHLDRVGDLPDRPALRARRCRPSSALLEHKFYFDELYDARRYRPRTAPCGAAPHRHRGAVRRGLARRDRPRRPRGRRGCRPPADRPAPRATRSRSRPPLSSSPSSSSRCADAHDDPHLPPASPPPSSSGWSRCREVGGWFAFLAAFAEVGIWIGGAARFDFGGGLQFSARHNWFCDLGVSYHVGFYGFSLWLAGLTVVVCALAIAYGVWAGRERPRAYYGLMLFLTARSWRFASQDLLLFYAFFEAMLIPIYVLVGVWGGPRRQSRRRSPSSSTRWPARC